MSYINDALHKVQKEKESPYASYGGVISVEAKKPASREKRVFAVGLIVVFFLAAGVVALLHWPEIRKTPPIATAQPAGVLKTPLSRPVASPEITAPLSAEVKVKKQNAAVSVNEIEQEVLPQPSPAGWASLYTQALQKQREGKLDEAKELYKQVIKKEPRHLQALNNLGVIYLKLKRYRWAIIRFNDALDIKHNYVDAHYNLACLYAQKNDTKQSLFYLKNAMNINPEVGQWAANDDDLKTLAGLPEFKKILQVRDK